MSGTRNIRRKVGGLERQWKVSRGVYDFSMLSSRGHSLITSLLYTALDPGNKMLLDYLQTHKLDGERNTVIELSGKTGSTSKYLAENLQDLMFRVQDDSKELLNRGESTLPAELTARVKFTLDNQEERNAGKASDQVLAIIVKNVLWCLPDEQCISYLQDLRKSIHVQQGATILLNELLSPDQSMSGIRDYHPYRRRDVTLMTMHNAKQRDENEWRAILGQVEAGLQVSTHS